MTVASDSRSPMKSCGAIMSFTVSIASPDLILSSARTHPLNHHSIPINYHHPHHWTSRFIVARNKTWHTNRVLKKFISQSQMSWATKTVFYRISCCVGVIYYFFLLFIHSFVSQERIISLTLFGFVEIVTLKLHIYFPPLATHCTGDLRVSNENRRNKSRRFRGVFGRFRARKRIINS